MSKHIQWGSEKLKCIYTNQSIGNDFHIPLSHERFTMSTYLSTVIWFEEQHTTSAQVATNNVLQRNVDQWLLNDK